MSHFLTFVIVNEDDANANTVAERLAPFDGNINEPTNDNAKWDWYLIGGRWNGYAKKQPFPNTLEEAYKEERCEVELNTLSVEEWLNIFRSEKIYPPHSIVLPNGEWHQEGQMGWFGQSTTEDNQWSQTVVDLLTPLKDKFIVVCDLHAY